MNTQEIINFLATLASEGRDNPNLSDILETENVSLPLAFAIQYGFASPTDKGIQAMTETYEYLAGAVEEYELEDEWGLLDIEESIPARTMPITINTDGTFS